MRRVLIYASVASMIQQFNMENIRLLSEQGYEIDVACNMERGSTVSEERIIEMREQLKEKGVNIYHIPIPRKITAFSDIIHSFMLTKQLINEHNYSLIHCHSPIGGIICRLGNRFSRNYGKTRMIYTAHGFHFYRGAPLKNWIMYYPVEKLCAHFTDILITINKEDYELAKHKLKAKQIEYVPGVGIDTKKFSSCDIDRAEKRKELGIPENAIWLLNVGELIPRKNQEIIIRAIADFENIFLTIAGKGDLKGQLENVAKEIGVSERVKLLGYRTDISELCGACDIFVFPSFQEGLPVALMEAMASGKTVVCSKIRGNTDLTDENGGALFDPYSISDCRAAIERVLNSDRKKSGDYNLKRISSFSLEKVNDKMMKIIGGYCHLETLILKKAKRKELGIPENAMLLVSVGELNRNKNHEVVIKALAKLNNPNIYYLIAGKGNLEGYLNDLIKNLNLENNIRLLGYRTDIAELYKAADIYCHPSLREGLPVSVIEAMSSGKPIISSNARGNIDLCQNNINGLVCSPFSSDEFSSAISTLNANPELCEKYGNINKSQAADFDISIINEIMNKIYFISDKKG